MVPLRGEGVGAGVVVGVAHELSRQVVAYGKHLQAVLGQELDPALRVALVLGCAVDVQVVSPACQLQAVVSPLGGFGGQLRHGDVCKLSGEQGNWPCHLYLPPDLLSVSC